jgi:hypothetical protein
MNRYRLSIGLAMVVGGSLLGVACGGDEPPAVTVNQAQPATAPPAEQAAAPPAATTSAPPAATTPAPDASTATPPSPAAPAAAEATAASSAAPGDALATEDHEIPGVQVVLTELRRTSGDTLTLRVQFRNTTDKEVSDSLFYGTSIARRTYLLDPSRKKYAVLDDGSNNPVGYVGQSSAIAPRGVVPAWVRFPAPPPEVTTVTVVLPGVPPIDGVPIR